MEHFPEFIANHLFLFSLLVSILMLLVWNIYGNTLSGVKIVSADEVTRLINREASQVIDLRSEKEFDSGHIIDAINISTEQLPKQLNKLTKHKDNGIILYCASGGIAVKETRKLMNEGFRKVYCLKGGILSWQQANLPLTRGINS